MLKFFIMKEAEKLKELNFQVYRKYGVIWVTFITPVLSRYLSRFLRKKGFVLQIDKGSGMIDGTWMSGPQTNHDYNRLRDIFKEYFIELPETTKVPEEVI